MTNTQTTLAASPVETGIAWGKILKGALVVTAIAGVAAVGWGMVFMDGPLAVFTSLFGGASASAAAAGTGVAATAGAAATLAAHHGNAHLTHVVVEHASHHAIEHHTHQHAKQQEAAAASSWVDRVRPEGARGAASDFQRQLASSGSDPASRGI